MTVDYSLTGIEAAAGLDSLARERVTALRDLRSRVAARNANLDAYYDGTVKVTDFGVTIDPETMPNDQVCFWPEKVVSALSDRIHLQGFSLPDGSQDASLSRVEERNRMANAYMRFMPGCLVHGCMFGVVGRNSAGTYVRFHNVDTAWGLPADDYDSGGVECGMAVAETGRAYWSPTEPVVKAVNLFEPGRVTRIEQRRPGFWSAHPMRVKEKQPMMVAFAHKATGSKPFGQSRINRAVQCITRDAIRTMFRMEVSGAYYSLPQRYLLGMSDEQYDQFVERKQRLYADSMMLMTRDEESNVPVYGQISGNSPQPFIEQMRFLATLLAGTTGVPLASLGVVQDNPSSAEAIDAAREDVILAAMRQMDADRASLARLARLAMAVEGNCLVSDLSPEQRAVEPRFADPRMASVASEADAWCKVAAIAPWAAETPLFFERMGFDAAAVASLQEAKRRYDANQVLAGAR